MSLRRAGPGATAAAAAILVFACGGPAPSPAVSTTPAAPTAGPSASSPGSSPASALPSAGTALPTEGPEDVATEVTGTERQAELVEPGTVRRLDGITQVRGNVTRTRVEASDPRVSGSATVTGNYDRFATGGPEWGTYRLENAAGSWEGSFAGIAWLTPIATEATEDLTAWLTGDGAYAGLTYYLHLHGTGGTYEVVGLIFPGPAPTR